MKILKTFKYSIKFICSKCGYPATVRKGSKCHQDQKCAPCIERTRVGKMDWVKWEKGNAKKKNQNRQT